MLVCIPTLIRSLPREVFRQGQRAMPHAYPPTRASLVPPPGPKYVNTEVDDDPSWAEQPIPNSTQVIPLLRPHSDCTRFANFLITTGLFAPREGQIYRDQQRTRRSQYDRGTLAGEYEAYQNRLRDPPRSPLHNTQAIRNPRPSRFHPEWFFRYQGNGAGHPAWYEDDY